MNDWLIDKGVPVFLAFLSILFVGLIGWAIYDDCVAEKFSLRKDQWQCAETKTETHITAIPIGKVIVPQVQETTYCVLWRKKT